MRRSRQSEAIVRLLLSVVVLLSTTLWAEDPDEDDVINPLEPIDPEIGVLEIYDTLPAVDIALPADPNEPPPIEESPGRTMPLPGSRVFDRHQKLNESLRRLTVEDYRAQQSLFQSQEVARTKEALELLDPKKDDDIPSFDTAILFNTPEADQILAKLQVFPPDSLWNQEISGWRVHANSKNLIASIGAGAALNCNYDMGFVIVPAKQTPVPVKITMYPEESDPGPFPVADNTPIEGWPLHPPGMSLEDMQTNKYGRGGDRHAIVLDPTRMLLHEFFVMKRTRRGWEAGQASTFDLTTNRLRPDGWTSADAAGLPIFPAVVRHDEISRGVINHALRVTVPRTRREYVAPATHFASRSHNINLPRMGERLRLRSDFSLGGFSEATRTILTALKTHGMFVADNGNWFAISIAPDERIPDVQSELARLRARDFEVVETPEDILARYKELQATDAP